MSANLSDRIIDSSKDLFEKIYELDLVQKLLMTGDLCEKNRSVAQRIYKNLTDVSSMSEKFFKRASELPLTADEKEFFDKVSAEYPTRSAKFLEDLKALVGPIPDEVMSAPPRPQLAEFQKRVAETLDKGSVIQILVGSLARYVIPSNVHKYLVSNPKYKESDLEKLLTFQTMGSDQILAVIKALIDERAKEVTPELENELKELFRGRVNFQLVAFQKQYEDVHDCGKGCGH